MDFTKLKPLFIALGVVISGGAGTVAGFFLAKHKYEHLADEEVKSVKEAYENHYGVKTSKEPAKPSKIPVDKSSISMEAKAPQRSYGTYYDKYDTSTKVPEKFDPNKPQMISEDDFAVSEYDNRSLIYWVNDDILSDDDNTVITDPVRLIGNEALTYLRSDKLVEGESVYVRNEAYQMDYEILQDSRKFYEVNNTHVSIHPSGDE